MAAAWNDLPATGGLHECAALVSSAEALRVSAPELSVQLARRALLVGATDASSGTNAGEIRHLSMRAQALLASGLVRISQHPKAVEPGFSALALAETGGASDVAAAVRIDLAACAQQVGEPLLGGALLRPVLDAAQTPPAVRAAALGRLVGCVAHVARRDDVEDALSEADRLLAADSGMGADVRRMERARLAVRTAGYHRWYGDTEDAITAAREGLNLLTRVREDLRSESDRLRARLVLELVCGLLDEGELREAEAAAHPTVDEPVRATSAASVGRLMLAVATRLYLPSGQMDRGRHLLDQAAWLAERHSLDGLRADALTEVSRLDEQAGRAGDALEAMRAARAAEHRRMRAVSRAARIVLVEVGAGHGIQDTAQQSVSALMRQLAHPAGLPVAVAAPPQVAAAQQQQQELEPRSQSTAPELAGTVDAEHNGNGLLDREGLLRRMRSARNGERPVALTLVRVEPNKETDRGPDTGIMTGLADKVRDMAPDNAELARSDGSELAVLLPAATRDQAEEFAATIRESDWPAATGKDMSISTGVVHTDHTTTDDEAGILTAARDAMTPAQAQAQANTQTETAAALQSALSEDTPTKPLNNAKPADPGQPAGRSILSSLSIPSGSGGRRRAGEEQPPGAKSRWPAEPAEAPRWTRAERRAQEAANNPADPATPDTAAAANGPLPTEEPSQGKRAATPARPSFSETRIGEATTAIDRTHLQSRHGTPAAPGQTTRRIQQTPTPAEPQPTPPETAAAHQAPATPSSQPTTEATATQGTAADAAASRYPSGGDGLYSQAAASSSVGHAQAGADVPGSQAAVGSDAQNSRAADAAASRYPSGGDGPYSQTAASSSVGHAQAGADVPNTPAAADFSVGHRDARTGADVPGSQAAVGIDALYRRAADAVAGRHGTQPGADTPDTQVAAGRGGTQPGADALYSQAADPALGRHGSQAGADTPDSQAAAEFSAGRRGSEVEAPDSQAAVGSSMSRHGNQVGAPESPALSGPRAGHNAPADVQGAPEVHDGPSVSADDTSPAASPGSQPRSADNQPPEVSGRRRVTLDAAGPLADRSVSESTSAPAEEAGFFSSLAGLSSGGMLLGAGDADRAGQARRSSYEETKAELAKMMSALNAKSLAARERNGARQTIPTPPEPDEVPEPPARPDVPEPPDPNPVLPTPDPEVPDPDRIPSAPESVRPVSAPVPPEPEVGGRSRLMAAFDALTGPVPGLRAEFDDAVELPARKPAESWAELETAAVVESPADELFGTEAAAAGTPRSSLGAAFAEFDTVEKKVTEPVKETVQETSYDQPIGPERRPAGLPRRGEKSSATIASLLTEAMAAYQSTAEDAESHQVADRFDAYAVDDAERPSPGARGRHRSPE